MFSPTVQSFQPNDLPVSHVNGASSSIRANNWTNGTNGFSDALEKASAKEAPTDKPENDNGQQPTVEGNRTQKGDDQAIQAVPVRENRSEKKQAIDQNQAASAQNASQAADAAASAAAQQASAAQTAGSDKTPKSEVTVTVSLTGLGDDLQVSLQGLSEELLNAILSACSNATGMAQAVTLGTAKQAGNVVLDESGVESVPDNNGKPTDNDGKPTAKLPVDSADATKGMNEILSLIQALTTALQNVASNKVLPQSGQAPITDLKASDQVTHLSPKEAPVNSAPGNQGLATAFTDLVSEPSSQDASATTTNTNESVSLNGLNVIPDSLSELKLPKGTELTESVLSKVKAAVTLPGVVEGANGTAEKEAQLPSEGNGSSSLAEQGASMQTNIERQEPVAEASNTTSFGSIVTDRLAAVAEQVGLREKPLDITLRLKTEGGESLMVGLKDQAGRVIVQVRSADGNVVNFLESQKGTIVRHLEAKQISSSISISPIEEDLTKRQGREQPKNGWSRRQQPANPFVETSI